MVLRENMSTSNEPLNDRSDEKKISSHTATLIAKGLIAGVGFDLSFYRIEVALDDRNRWRVEFVLKNRYAHCNVRCATVYINSQTGEVGENSYYDCNTLTRGEHSTKGIQQHSLPDGNIGIYIGEGIHMYEITPSEWEALYWDELGATDPNYAPEWQKIFRNSLPNYPNLSQIRGEYGSKVTFKDGGIDALMNECIQITETARDPIALDLAKTILAICDLAKKEKTVVSFVGD